MSVQNGRIHHVSVSQIQSFAKCPLQWWYGSVAGIKAPPSKSQEVGKKVHSEIEHYLKTGEDVLGPIARVGKHLLPAPGPDLLVEHRIEGDLFGRLPLLGFIDLVVPRDGVELVDHKTTSSIEKYASSADDLKDPETSHGIQMLGYGRWASLHYPGIREIKLSHNYHQTKGTPVAEKRSTVVDLTTLNKSWNYVERLAGPMADTAKIEDPNDVKADTSHCWDYGGCPHQNRCPAFKNRDPKEMFKMSLMQAAAALAQKSQLTPTPALVSSTPPPAPSTADAVRAVADAIAARNLPAATAAPKPLIVDIPDTTGEQAVVTECTLDCFYLLNDDGLLGKFQGTSKKQTGETVGIFLLQDGRRVSVQGDVVVLEAPPPDVLPPDAAPRTNPLAAPPPMTAPVPAPAFEGIVIPATEAEAKQGRGRPRGSKNKPKDDVAPVLVAEAAPLPPPPPAPTIVAREPEPSTIGPFRLWINAIPLHAKWSQVDVAAVCERAAKIDGVSHWRLTEYGKGKATVALVAKQNPPQGNAVIFTRDSEDAALVAEALAPLAVEVHRGV